MLKMTVSTQMLLGKLQQIAEDGVDVIDLTFVEHSVDQGICFPAFIQIDSTKADKPIDYGTVDAVGF